MKLLLEKQKKRKRKLALKKFLLPEKKKKNFSCLPYDPASPFLGIYPEKSIIQKDTYTPVFTAALFTIAKTQKQPKCPLTKEWIKKMWCIYTHTHIYI